MKILYIITKSEIGGAQEHVRALVMGARAAGHEVVLASGREGWLMTQTRAAGIKAVVLPGLERSWNPLAAFKYTGSLKWLIAAEKPNIVHFHSSNAMFGIPAARSLGAAAPGIVATVHGLSALHPGWKKSAIVKFAYRQAMRRLLKDADRVIFVCRSDRDLALEMDLARRTAAEVIPNGIAPNFAVLPRDEAQARLGLPADGFMFGATARFDYAKNIGGLLDAFAALYPPGDSPSVGQSPLDARLCLVGNGPEEAALKKTAAASGVAGRIHFAGQVPEARKFLKAFDCLVLSSRYEGLPYSILEAMAAGVPVVATAVGGLPELIEDGVSGLLVPPGDVAALAAAMKKMASDPELRERLAGAGRNKVKNEFSEQKMVKLTLGVYGEFNK